MSILVLALCLVAAFACTAESRSHGKINALLKRMEKTIALKKYISEENAVTAAIKGPDDCDHDGGDGILYWCLVTDTCCHHQVENGVDGDWVCCDASDYPVICASNVSSCNV